MTEPSPFAKRPPRQILPRYEALFDAVCNVDEAVARLRRELNAVDAHCQELEALAAELHTTNLLSEVSEKKLPKIVIPQGGGPT